MNKLLQALERLGLKPDDVKFCLEATGHYWLPIYCYLTNQGFELHVINPIQSDALRNLYVRKTKTDQKDALLLADLLRLGRAPRPDSLPKQPSNCSRFPDSALSSFARSVALRTGCLVFWIGFSLNTQTASPMCLSGLQGSCLNLTRGRKN